MPEMLIPVLNTCLECSFGYFFHTALVTFFQSCLNFINNNVLDQGISEKVKFKLENITLNSALTTSISVITMLLLLFIYMPEEWFNIVGLIALTLYKY